MIPLDPSRCPDCAGPLRVVSQSQPALFPLHGHGGTETVTEVACPACAYWRHRSTETSTPREAPRIAQEAPGDVERIRTAENLL